MLRSQLCKQYAYLNGQINVSKKIKEKKVPKKIDELAKMCMNPWRLVI